MNTITAATRAILYSPFVMYCASFFYLVPRPSLASLSTLYMAIELWNKLNVNNLFPESKRVVCREDIKLIGDEH